MPLSISKRLNCKGFPFHVPRAAHRASENRSRRVSIAVGACYAKLQLFSALRDEKILLQPFKTRYVRLCRYLFPRTRLAPNQNYEILVPSTWPALRFVHAMTFGMASHLRFAMVRSYEAAGTKGFRRIKAISLMIGVPGLSPGCIKCVT